VLARQQKAPLGALREIWSRHDQARSGLPLLQLGIALKAMGDAPRGEQALKLAMSHAASGYEPLAGRLR
jgi:uncharacterized protein YfaS (alpha-2-macroglobulin family)